MKQLHVQVFYNLLEAPGTLPDLPGWILGHVSEVETKSTFCQKVNIVEQNQKMCLQSGKYEIWTLIVKGRK